MRERDASKYFLKLTVWDILLSTIRNWIFKGAPGYLFSLQQRLDE